MANLRIDILDRNVNFAPVLQIDMTYALCRVVSATCTLEPAAICHLVDNQP